MKKLFAALFLFIIFIGSSFAQTLPLRVNLGIGGALPLSDFANQYSGGLSLNGGLFYKIPKSDICITLSAGYSKFNYSKEYFNDLVLKNLGLTIENFTFNWNAEDIPIMLGARVKFPSGLVSPYVTGEAGIHIVKINDRFNGDTVNVTTTIPHVFYFNGIETGSETGFGFGIGFGLECEIYPRVNVDVNFKYNYTKLTVTKPYTVYMTDAFKFTATPLEKLTSFTVRAGLVIDL